jgi:Holliday junction resolvase
MVKTFRVVRGVLALALAVWVSGCVTGKVLTLPGELERPQKKETEKREGGWPTVAVLDFTFAGASPHEIGRDFDHARAIVWKGEPGKALSDLIVDVLNEKGVRAVRVSDKSAVPADVAAKVWGSVEKFRVETRKTGSLKVKVESAAVVSVTVYGSGGTAPTGWSSAVASDFVTTDPLFVTPGGIRDAVNGAANAVAEETVRRLFEAGVVTVPSKDLSVPPGR